MTNVERGLIYQIIWCDIKNFRMAVKFSTVFGKFLIRKRNMLLQGNVC